MKLVWLLAGLLLLQGHLFVRAEGEAEEAATVEDPDDEGTEVPGQDEPAVPAGGEEGAEGAEDDSVIKASPDIRTSVLFPTFANKDFPAGSLIDVLVGISNTGSNTFKIVQVEGSFRYPQDFKYHMQNFSALPLSLEITPTQQWTIHYKFRPDTSFEPREFGMTINVDYIDTEERVYQTAAFNDTIRVTDPVDTLDAQTLFTYVGGAAALAVVALVAFQRTQGKTAAPAKAKRVERGTASPTEEEDNPWLANMQRVKSPAKTPRRTPSKGSKSDGEKSE